MLCFSIRLSGGWHCINLGGIKEIDAARDAVVHDGVRSRLIHLLPKSHGSKTDRGDVQIALTQANRSEVEVFHEGEFSWAQRMKIIYYVWCAVPGRVCLRQGTKGELQSERPDCIQHSRLTDLFGLQTVFTQPLNST